MKVGIIRLSALGDIIMSVVFLPYLKKIYPDIELHWFVDERFSQILEYSPCIDKLHKLPLKEVFRSLNPYRFYKLYKTLKSYGEYDLIIDMQGLLKSSAVGKIIKKKRFVGFDKNSIREKVAAYFYDEGVEIAYKRNVLERNAKLLFWAVGGFDVVLEGEIDEHWIEKISENRFQAFGFSQNSESKIESLKIFDNSKKTILFILEASIESKTYPIEQYVELARLLKNENVKIILPWKGNPQKAQKIFAQIHTFIDTVVLPELTQDELKALISKVDLVIGGDTGVTHLGWAMGRSSITLYGNTPIERLRVTGERNISLSGNLNAECDKNDFSIRNISPKEIFESIGKIL
ncbi:lipopolysaccharide heptosyltransferase I [Helicobacter cappadocius]|uniref:Lipopolysaccharide heptosyltransferase 1 n=1 Tax=Helicobacter cappadocius TaxID=3063998 RepID=A0AA90PIG5_9HELI|nr:MULTISPECIES: lipopolysaccharide heptosyltransferase I [unclassified Helicobacter]MDO7252303.1 lipopolysaccharide heptosyltransferase I [Helicobacter sp. faydin-H75]MDP2538170.1 lipopolysaccharide heptosyltransferase I [Helicobacter sp. faydin-H76]